MSEREGKQRDRNDDEIVCYNLFSFGVIQTR